MTLLRTHRRGFLKLGGSAGLAAVAGLRALPAAAAPPAGAGDAGPGAFFSDREREILRALVERLVETGDPRAPTLDDTGTLATIEAACAALPPDVTGQLPVALQLFEWWPFLLELRFRPFSALDAEDRDASLRGWMESRFAARRLAFRAVRNLALLGFWSQQETWPLIGYRGPLLASDAVPTEEPGATS